MGADENQPLFYCGNADLNAFFHEDSKVADRELVAVTYAVEMDGSTVAFLLCLQRLHTNNNTNTVGKGFADWLTI